MIENSKKNEFVSDLPVAQQQKSDKSDQSKSSDKMNLQSHTFLIKINPTSLYCTYIPLNKINIFLPLFWVFSAYG